MKLRALIREQTQLKSTVRDCSTNLVVLDCIFDNLIHLYNSDKTIHNSVPEEVLKGVFSMNQPPVLADRAQSQN